MRGIRAAVCETSLVEPDTGLVIRGYPVKKLVDRYPEEILWLLLTGEFPDEHSLQWLQSELKKRSRVRSTCGVSSRRCPRLAPDVHVQHGDPVHGRESVFHRHYDEGLTKEHYWEETLDDALTIIARLPQSRPGSIASVSARGPGFCPTRSWTGRPTTAT